MARNRKKKKLSQAAIKAAAKAADSAGEKYKGFNLGKILESPGFRGAAGMLALEQLLGAGNRRADRGVQSEALQMQGEATTAESLYVQAALPQARQEESMARQMLMQQISGGVTGPQIGRGERLIGGR